MFIKGRCVLLASIALIIAPVITLAQKKIKADKDSLSLSHKNSESPFKQVQVEEVVVTAQYAPQAATKSMYKVSVIDSKQIELSASQNLRDVLRNSMNIRLSQDNILGSSMSLQGISGENVKILIDGVPIIGRQDGNLDLSQINLNNIERIEIIEGPVSVNYGTNALAGVINLISKKDQKDQTVVSLQSYYESVGQYNISANAGIKKKYHQFLFSGGRNFFDGWSNNENWDLIPSSKPADASRFQQWKPKEQHFFEGQYSLSIDNFRLTYRGNYFTEKISNLGTPRSPYNESAFDDYYYTTRIDNSLQINGKTLKNKNYNILVAYNDYKRIKNTYYTDLTTLGRTLSENEGAQDTSAFNLFTSRGSFTSAKDQKKLNYEFGYDISIENAVGRRIENNYQNISDYALFTSVEYSPISKLIIRPGLRYSYNTDYKSPLIPSLNIKYNISRDLTMRASYAKGFRAPSLKELYFYFVDINHNIVGNSTIQAEKSNNYNISFSYLQAFEKTSYKFEPSFFYNDIYNMITLAQLTGTEYTYRNTGRFQTTGFQLNNTFLIYQFKIELGGSYIGRSTRLPDSLSADKFTFYPEGRLNIIHEWKKLNLTTALFYKYSGEVPNFIINENNELAQRITEDFHTADITVTKSFLQRRLNVGIGAKNIFNVKNITSFSSGGAHSAGTTTTPIAMGRTYFVKLDFRFSK